MLPLVTKPLVMIDVIYSRYNKENNTFFNSLRKNDVEAQVEITLNWKELGSPVIDVSFTTNSLLVICTQIFRNSGRSVWKYSGKGETIIRKVQVRTCFAITETLSITGQKFSKCLKKAATVYERDNCYPPPRENTCTFLTAKPAPFE